MDIWRINCLYQSLAIEKTPEHLERLGGRALTAQILLDEVPPTCESTGRENKLIFAIGLLAGHHLTSCDRISVGGKSPLTGGIKESNAGGTLGYALASLAIKALILEDIAEEWSIIYITNKRTHFFPAGEIVGLGVYAAANALQKKFGPKCALAIIGPAGERLYKAAGISNLDREQVPSRIAARGGLGALMGSKRIKAIVVDNQDGIQPPLHNKQNFIAAQKRYTEAVLNHPQTAVYRDFGTDGIARIANLLGAMPTRNFSSGSFEQIDEIAAENLRETILWRGGEGSPSHACMAGCGIRCSNNFPNSEGHSIVAPLEYETIGMLGANLGIGSLDRIAEMNLVLNDLGLDTIEIGAALGLAAENGLWEMGNADGAMALIANIQADSPWGRILGNGAAFTGLSLGSERIPVVKGQAFSAYDPRAIKGTGVTYATSPMGADHTAGLTIRAQIDHLNPSGQAKLSRTAQINMAGYDSLGACIFAGFGFASAPGVIEELIQALYGWDVQPGFLQLLGKAAILTERKFNQRAGFTKKDDRLPEWLTREPLVPTNTIFDVPEDDLDHIWEE